MHIIEKSELQSQLKIFSYWKRETERGERENRTHKQKVIKTGHKIGKEIIIMSLWLSRERNFWIVFGWYLWFRLFFGR